MDHSARSFSSSLFPFFINEKKEKNDDGPRNQKHDSSHGESLFNFLISNEKEDVEVTDAPLWSDLSLDDKVDCLLLATGLASVHESDSKAGIRALRAVRRAMDKVQTDERHMGKITQFCGIIDNYFYKLSLDLLEEACKKFEAEESEPPIDDSNE